MVISKNTSIVVKAMLLINTERSPIVATEAYRFALAERLRAAQNSCLIISAYLTVDGLRWIADCLPPSIPVSILTRWEANDLVTGASDTASYWMARERGWSFKTLNDLHAKCCLIDDDTLFIGSANITNRGLCLFPGGNRELGLYVKATDSDQQVAWSLFRCGRPLTDALVQKIETWIEGLPASARARPLFDWPIGVENYFGEQLMGLWVADLPWSNFDRVSQLLRGEFLPEQELSDARHDLSVFSASSTEELARGYRGSNCFKWLVNAVSEEPEGFAFFGRITEKLHTSLLDDPRPYRKDVKGIVSNLISYTTRVAADILNYDRPNYSERLSVTSKPGS